MAIRSDRFAFAWSEQSDRPPFVAHTIVFGHRVRDMKLNNYRKSKSTHICRRRRQYIRMNGAHKKCTRCNARLSHIVGECPKRRRRRRETQLIFRLMIFTIDIYDTHFSSSISKITGYFCIQYCQIGAITRNQTNNLHAPPHTRWMFHLQRLIYCPIFSSSVF